MINITIDGQFLFGLAATLVAFTGVMAQWRLGGKVERTIEKIDEVKREVTTGNAQTLAQFADSAESRRIKEIPVGERSAEEQDHIDTLGGAK